MRWLRPEHVRPEWRWRFAYLPTRIGDEVLWLEKYQQRGGGCFYDRRLYPGAEEHTYSHC